MKFCKQCALHLISNIMLVAIIYFAAALAFQINTGIDINYYITIFILIAIVIKSWSDKKIGDSVC